jgi:CubicO group peptidase (beta-lactamase class C family)
MTSRIVKTTLGALVAILVAGAAVIAVSNREPLHHATASVSRSLCGAVFISHVDPDRLFREEALPQMRSIGWAMRYRIDRDRREVRTTVLGMFTSRAAYREGLGCLLLPVDDSLPEAMGLKDAVIAAALPGPGVVEPADPGLRHALDAAFSEPDPTTPRLTKAIVVLHDGKLIAERYAPGYGPETPIWGHSLTKSITSALIGILVRQGKLRLDQPAPIAAWSATSDPRRTVTIDQLLRMDSGLPFDETGGPVNLATHMWFRESNMTAYAAKVPLEHAPGTAWGYSNLGYMLLSRVAMDAAGAHTAVAAERFVRSALFAPLGMRNAVIETDVAGTPIGSSHVYASARDFARFGQFYLDDGVVDGRRILPEGWVAYSHSQTLDTGYGAGFWTNLVNQGTVPVWDAPWGMPKLPKDMFYARGAFGQYIVIVPSEKLVVVRMGISLEGGTGIGEVVAGIIDALHRPSN